MRYYLFTTTADFAREAEDAGIDGLVVDWERRGKMARQRNYDFEINRQGVREVRRVAEAVSIPVLVRINPVSSRTIVELQKAIDAGAREIMLPMARQASEVERFLELAAGRVRTVVQIETQDLVNDLPALARLPGREVGFAGITVADGGSPLPFAQLFAEMVRLGCALSFLRRTFHKEIAGRDLAAEIAAVRILEKSLRAREADRVAEDRAAFARLLTPFAK